MPWRRGGRSSRSAKATVARGYEPYRCPPDAYTRVQGRFGLKPAHAQAVALITVVVVAIAATLSLLRLELRQSAGKLRAADEEQSLIAADIGEYEDRLRAAQEMVGGSSRALSIVVLEMSGELSEAEGYYVTCLSVLERIVTVTEVVQPEDRVDAVRRHFEGIKTRMQDENPGEPETDAPSTREQRRPPPLPATP